MKSFPYTCSFSVRLTPDVGIFVSKRNQIISYGVNFLSHLTSSTDVTLALRCIDNATILISNTRIYFRKPFAFGLLPRKSSPTNSTPILLTDIFSFRFRTSLRLNSPILTTSITYRIHESTSRTRN